MLANSDIVILTASFYLAGVFTQFFTSLSKDIILPIIAPITAAQKDVSSFTIRIGSVELKVGEFLSELVNLLIALVITIFAVGLLKT
jgi:large-conductance mechanosensitive channel